MSAKSTQDCNKSAAGITLDCGLISMCSRSERGPDRNTDTLKLHLTLTGQRLMDLPLVLMDMIETHLFSDCTAQDNLGILQILLGYLIRRQKISSYKNSIQF